MSKRIASLFLALALLCSGSLAVTARAAQLEPLVLQSSKSDGREIQYYYDWDGNCVREEWVGEDRYTEYTYSANHVLAQERVYRSGKLVLLTDYDPYGTKVAGWALRNDGTLVQEVFCTPEYDAYGRLIFYREDGIYQTRIRYEYDYYEAENPTFGRYEQDGNISNGPEPIEWEVLSTSGDYVLLISKYALDSQYFYETDIPMTWGRSDLRGWLNANFLYSAFTEEEQAQIAPVVLDKEAGEDSVFLLSKGEVLWYYPKQADRVCLPTRYARNQDAYTGADNGGCRWLLRDSGKTATRVVRVNPNGSIDRSGGDVSDPTGAVRPVLWVHADAPSYRSDRVCRETTSTYASNSAGEEITIEANIQTYDQAGRRTCLQQYYSYGMPADGLYTWEFDAYGNPVAESMFIADLDSDFGGYLKEEYLYTNVYNNRSQLTSVTMQYTFQCKEESGTTTSETENTIAYSYDEDGNMISRATQFANGDIDVETWEYDRCGNLLKAARNGDTLEENIYVPLSEAIWK